MLLVIAWGPIPATRMVIPVLVMIGLVALGVAMLRRQVAVEFPDATVGEAHATWQARVAHARATAGEALRRHRPAAADSAGNGDGAAPTLSASDRVALLERLTALHDRGALTDEELAARRPRCTSAALPESASRPQIVPSAASAASIDIAPAVR